MTRFRRALLAVVVAALTIVPAVALAAPPSNDNFAAAAEIPAAGGTVTSTNVDSTNEAGEPNHAGSPFGEAIHSVWFKWTAPADGTTTVDTCNSAFNTRLGVYTGSAVSALTEVASNENTSPSSCGQPLFAALSFQATAGTTYRIAVDTSGGVPDDMSGPPQGEVRLALDGPDVPPGTDDDKTTPGTRVPGEILRFRVPNLNPSGTAFTSAFSIARLLTELRNDGLTYEIDADPYASKEAETKKQRDFLREKGVGGEIIRGTFFIEDFDGTNSVALSEGSLAEIDTANQQLVFSVDFFDLLEDKKWLAQEKADLERNARDRLEAERREREREEAKSKCLPVAAGESNKQIAARFPKAKSPFTSYADAIEVFKKLGCDLVVEKYVKGKPSDPHAYVKDVLRTDPKTVYVSLAQPGSHDFVFTVREDPTDYTTQPIRKQLPVDWTGDLTVSDEQSNRVTVQVIERASGRLVAGIPVTFSGADGAPQTETTDGNGEVTFTPRFSEPRVARISASYLEMEGWLNIVARDKKGKSYLSLAGRTIKSTDSGYTGASEAELNFAKSLPVVPAIMGTGKITEIDSSPAIDQAQVTKVDASGLQFTGQYNTIDAKPTSQTLIAAGPGLIAAADATKTPPSRRAARAGLPSPLEFLGAIVSPLSFAIDQGVANIRTALNTANQAAIAATANLIGQAGGNLISDKGLGVISVGGGNLIGQAGGNLISDKGLGVISVGGGNLIGQAGGNLISDKGLGLISTGNSNLMPVHGGRMITSGGAG